MKTKKLLIIALTAAALCVQAQNRMFEFNVGTLNPKDTPAGLIFSGAYGISVDERVDISVGLGVFHKGYTQDTQVAETVSSSGVVEHSVVRSLEYSTTLLPLSVNATISIPFQPPLDWYVGAGLSWQVLFNKETNFAANISESKRYSGFGYQLRAGAQYMIGSRSSLIAEAFYNGCKVKNSEDVKQGLPVWNEVNVSGLGIRAGLRLLF